jgi:hypothetical protein
MDERLRILARVREVRVRLAATESTRRRLIEARAQAALEEVLRLRAHYENVIAQASIASSLCASHDDEARFGVAEAQSLLNYALSARLKAEEAVGSIRRAQLVCQHAEASADEARGSYLRATGRHEKVLSKWREHLMATRGRRYERQDETLIEDRSSNASVAAREGER